MVHSSIGQTINIAKEVLESHYPDAVVKSTDPGECDYRVSSVGASIFVSGAEVHPDATQEIMDRVDEEVEGRTLLHKEIGSEIDSEKHKFDIKTY